MSQMWNRTLVYLGLREEPEEMYDERPQRFVPEDDPYAEHAPQRPNIARERAVERDLVGASAGSRDSGPRDSGPRDTRPLEPRASSRGRDDNGDDRPVRRSVPAPDDLPRLVTEDDLPASTSNVRPLRVGSRNDADPAPAAVRVAVVELERFEDVEAVGARYRTGQAVLFDIVGGSGAVGRRVVDFVAGLTYASHGTLTKVGSRAFLLVPDQVEVGEVERRRLRDLGYRVPESR